MGFGLCGCGITSSIDQQITIRSHGARWPAHAQQGSSAAVSTRMVMHAALGVPESGQGYGERIWNLRASRFVKMARPFERSKKL
jgi:hypothetical protein